jgi:hypothetical protein
MKSTLLTLALVALALVTACVAGRAQETGFHRNHVAVGIGPAIPTGNTGNYLGTAPMVNLRYGYRFNRLLQGDAGFAFLWGAANNQNAVITDLGQVQGGDHEFMLPLGGRIILPLPFKPIEASVGGGGIYLHYSETAPSNPYYQSTAVDPKGETTR